jgi:hypothetical protein
LLLLIGCNPATEKKITIEGRINSNTFRKVTLTLLPQLQFRRITTWIPTIEEQEKLKKFVAASLQFDFVPNTVEIRPESSNTVKLNNIKKSTSVVFLILKSRWME